MLVFIILLLQPPVYLVILAYISAILGVVFTAFTGILIDLKSPKLNWDNEQKAVKQNFNLLFNMFFGIIVAVGAIVLTTKLQLGLWQTFVLIAAVFTTADLVLYYISSTIGARLYEKIMT
jgi:ABC-2 type transport system permease protein